MLPGRTYGNVMRVYIEEQRKWMLLGTINITVSAGGAKNFSDFASLWWMFVGGEVFSLLFVAINACI